MKITQIYVSECQLDKQPIAIALNSNHFTALVGKKPTQFLDFKIGYTNSYQNYLLASDLYE